MCSDLQLKFDPAGAVVRHEAFQCSLQDDIFVGNIGTELLPVIGYGFLNIECLAHTFFSGFFYDNGFGTMVRFVPALFKATAFYDVHKVAVGKIASHLILKILSVLRGFQEHLEQFLV